MIVLCIIGALLLVLCTCYSDEILDWFFNSVIGTIFIFIVFIALVAVGLYVWI